MKGYSIFHEALTINVLNPTEGRLICIRLSMQAPACGCAILPTTSSNHCLARRDRLSSLQRPAFWDTVLDTHTLKLLSYQ